MHIHHILFLLMLYYVTNSTYIIPLYTFFLIINEPNMLTYLMGFYSIIMVITGINFTFQVIMLHLIAEIIIYHNRIINIIQMGYQILKIMNLKFRLETESDSIVLKICDKTISSVELVKKWKQIIINSKCISELCMLQQYVWNSIINIKEQFSNLFKLNNIQSSVNEMRIDFTSKYFNCQEKYYSNNNLSDDSSQELESILQNEYQTSDTNNNIKVSDIESSMILNKCINESELDSSMIINKCVNDVD